MSAPINFHLIQKTELVTDPKTGKDKWPSLRSRNEIARDTIASAVNRQIPFRYVLNDIWFASAENMVFIKSKKKDFIIPGTRAARVKGNRKVALSEARNKQGKWQPISSLSFETDAPVTVNLESVPFALLLSGHVFANGDGSEGIQYQVTSDLSLSASSMATIYQKRWKVEEYYKSLKSNASFAKSPTKRIRTQSNHFFSCLVAFVKLETCRIHTTLNHFAVKAKLCQAALTTAFGEWQRLKMGTKPSLSHLTA